MKNLHNYLSLLATIWTSVSGYFYKLVFQMAGRGKVGKICIVLLTVIILFSNCTDPEKVFNGEIHIVKKPDTNILTGQKIILDGLYAGNPKVYDSIISFTYHYDEYFAASFNLKTGKHIGNFFKRGTGPAEFASLGILHPESGYSYWMQDYNKSQYVLVDLSTGEEKKRIDLTDYKKEGRFFFIRGFVLNDSLLIAANQQERKNQDYDMTVPQFRVFNYLANKEITTYTLYDEDLYNKLRKMEPDIHEDSNHLIAAYLIKPDKSKVAAAMCHLFQISIFDLETSEWKGFRIEDTPGFEIIKTPSSVSSIDAYYYAAADDEFIYAMLGNHFKPNENPVIHVFDWDGNFVRILEFDQKGVRFGLDSKWKKLYFKDAEEDENVWMYDVSYLYK